MGSWKSKTELPDPVKCLESKLCPILLKIGHIIQLNSTNSKMEFTNHFAKIQQLVWEYTTTFGCQVQIIVDVINLWVHFLLSRYSSFKSDESGHFSDFKTAYINNNENLTPKSDSIFQNQGMDFGKMVFKFHFWIPCVELNYVSNFQQNWAKFAVWKLYSQLMARLTKKPETGQNLIGKNS